MPRTRGSNQRGQSLTEFALVLPVLLLVLAAGSDFGRVFFISSQVTDSTREAALYAVQHASDPGQTPANLDSQMRSIMANAERGGFAPLTCSSWSNPPTAAEVSITFTGAIPPAAGVPTTVEVSSDCDIPSLFGYPGLPSIYSTKSEVVSEAVGGI